MNVLTVADIRDLVVKALTPTINIHRSSKRSLGYETPEDFEEITDDEIDDFIFHNAMFPFEVMENLTDPGLLGFAGNKVTVSNEWLGEFVNNANEWAQTNAWIGADGSFIFSFAQRDPVESDIWVPANHQPLWINSSPSCLLVANQLLREGKLLSEMGWRQFEELIGVLLESEGWKVEVTRQTRDGGIDVIAFKEDGTIGPIKAIWQAKKYGPKNSVKLSDVRELSAIRDESKATKALIVTTSRLTRDAIEWIKKDLYRLDFKDHQNLEKWINGIVF